MAKTNQFLPGRRVRLTGKFLRSIGSTNGQSKWTIQACSCSLCVLPAGPGGFICTDEPSSYGGLRHISMAHIQIVAGS